MTGVLKKGGNLDTDMYRRNTVKTQGEDGHLWPEERSLEQILPQSSGGTYPADTFILDLYLHNYETVCFCCLSHLVCGPLLWKPEQTKTPPCHSFIKY